MGAMRVIAAIPRFVYLLRNECRLQVAIEEEATWNRQ